MTRQSRTGDDLPHCAAPAATAAGRRQKRQHARAQKRHLHALFSIRIQSHPAGAVVLVYLGLDIVSAENTEQGVRVEINNTQWLPPHPTPTAANVSVNGGLTPDVFSTPGQRRRRWPGVNKTSAVRRYQSHTAPRHTGPWFLSWACRTKIQGDSMLLQQSQNAVSAYW